MSLVIENCNVGGRAVSVSVSEGRVQAVVEGAAGAPPGTTRIEGAGRSLVPGMIDSHCHPFSLGWLRGNLDLKGTSNITAMRLRLRSRVQKARPGEWVVGRGWDQDAFAEKRLPDRADIDDLSPKNPAILTRVCGHIALLNSAAVTELGLEESAGQEYERDSGGRMTGIIKEGALERAFASIPRAPESAAGELLAAEYEAAKKGLTALHCIVSPGSYKEELRALASLAAEGKLSLRYRVYIPFEAMDYVEEKGLRAALKGDGVRINGVKLFADGSLGARTAALREPYHDDQGNQGMLRHTDEELAEMAEKADSAGYQVIVHAIGDRAVEQAADALEPLTGRRNEKMHRIEHASLLPPDLLRRLASSSICCAVQPPFITSDTWARERLGNDRAEHLYPLKSMLSAGLTVSGGSDAPVESISPIAGIWSAMARSGYGSGQELDWGKALGLYTTGSARNGLDEATLGEIEPGMWADLTLLDSDIEGMHPSMVRKVGVAASFVGGQQVYSYE